MAYFANGSEGAILDNQCWECLHNYDDVFCPVSAVQMNYNYDQVGNADLEAAMLMLIDADGICLMRKALIEAGLLTSVE